jgi:hypothetical protein
MHFRLLKPLHGWRAFVGEVGIIVLGVLIALAAGQIIEIFHWREKAKAAEHAMRLELAEDDGPQAYARVAIGPCFDRQLAMIHDGAETAPPDQLRKWIASYSPPFRTWDSEAWKAVASSDVGNYMGAERLVDWSAAYRTLPAFSDMNLRETELAAELRDSLPGSGDPSPADRKDLRRLAGQLRVTNERMVRESQLFLARTRRLDATVSNQMQNTLIRSARSIYGACATAPDFGAQPLAQSPTANLRGFDH